MSRDIHLIFSHLKEKNISPILYKLDNEYIITSNLYNVVYIDGKISIILPHVSSYIKTKIDDHESSRRNEILQSNISCLELLKIISSYDSSIVDY